MPMPQDDLLKDATLFTHIQAVIVTLHYLDQKLCDTAKSRDVTDKRIMQILHVLSRHLTESKVKLDRHINRLEKRVRALEHDAV